MTVPIEVEKKPNRNSAALTYLLSKKSERPKLVYVSDIGSCERVPFSEVVNKILGGISIATVSIGALCLAAGIGGNLLNSIGNVNYEEVERLNTIMNVGGGSLAIGLGTAAAYGVRRILNNRDNKKVKPDDGRLAEAIRNEDPTSDFARTFLSCFSPEGCSDKFKQRLVEKLSHHRDGIISDINSRDGYGYFEREALGELAEFLLETRDNYQRGASQNFRNSSLMNMFATNAKRLVEENEGKPKRIDSLQLLNDTIKQYQERTDIREIR